MQVVAAVRRRTRCARVSCRRASQDDSLRLRSFKHLKQWRRRRYASSQDRKNAEQDRHHDQGCHEELVSSGKGAEHARPNPLAIGNELLVRVLDRRCSVFDRGPTFVGRSVDVDLSFLLVALVELRDGLKVVVRRCDVPRCGEVVLLACHVGVGLDVSHDAFLRIGEMGQSDC
jgi:hypothetical protein